MSVEKFFYGEFTFKIKHFVLHAVFAYTLQILHDELRELNKAPAV